MQSRPIAHLARRLRAVARQSNWREAAEQCNVRDVDGNASPGIAHMIAIKGFEPSRDLMWRLIGDGAIPRPAPMPIILDQQTRKAIILALKERKPLPPPTAEIARKFDAWLSTRPIIRRTAWHTSRERFTPMSFTEGLLLSTANYGVGSSATAPTTRAASWITRR